MAGAQYNVDESVVKKPQHEEELTAEQAEEWLKCALDKEYWMETYAFVQTPKGKALFFPRDYQKDMIDLHEEMFTVSVAPRQCGKTICVAVDVLHDIIFAPDFNVGITSYKLANCKDFLDRIKYTYENLPTWMKPPAVIYNQSQIKFTNNSSIRVQVTKENTFRGFTLQRIVLDEFAFVKPNVAEEFWTSLLPSISAAGEESDTRLNIISTPNGTAGQFANVWFGAVNGVNGFKHLFVEWQRIPGRTEEFKKSMMKKMGRNKYLQEFECQFISDKGTLVNSMTLEQMRFINPVREINDLRLFTEDFTGRKLAMACDVSEGIGQDFHAIQIFDIDSFEQVGEFHNNYFTQTQYTKEIIKILHFLFDEGAEEVYYTVEANAVGAGVMRLIENSMEPVLDRATLISDIDGNRLGMLTTAKSKLSGCVDLKDALELNKIKLNSERLITELKFFIRKGSSFAAEPGMNDDLVMATVLTMNLLKILANYEDNIFELVNEIQGLNEDEEVYGIFF